MTKGPSAASSPRLAPTPRSQAASGEALAGVVQHRPDLIILDLGLPDIDGIEVTRRLREWTQIPIIILSVQEQETDKIAALDAGADDYLTKPFHAGELMARIRAALRRAVRQSRPRFGERSIGGFHASGEMNVEVKLTPTEYDLLRVLVKNAGRVLTHQQLLRQVWGTGYESEYHMLRVNISNLRHKIEPSRARAHHHEPGVGYRLQIS
jgi:two-component system KDP operon response regulator KdpE